MIFSLLHPSRGRAAKAFETFCNWMAKGSINNRYEYILSIDSDDPVKEQYRQCFKDSGVIILENSNRSLIDAANEAAKKATGDLFILVSDDFDCPKNWDELLPKKRGAYAIHVQDGIQTANDCMTIPIISKALYKELGYIYNPIYFHVFCDNDLFEVCKLKNKIIYSDLLFQHKHYTKGFCENDATYRKGNSEAAYINGRQIFERRKSEGFV